MTGATTQPNVPPGRPLWGPQRAFMALYVAQFLFLGVQLPFLPGWLDARGFEPADIGLMVGAALVLRLLLAPPLAYRAESLRDPRLAIRLAAGGLFALSAILIAPVPNSVVALVGIGVLFCFGLLVPLTDTAVLRADRRGALAYGPVRGGGSAAFIVASLVGGALITATSDEVAIIWLMGAGALTFAAAMALPREPGADAGAARPTLRQAFGLFRSRSFLLMLFAGGLVQGGHATYYSFSELHWSALGYSSLLIGTLWTVGVLVEVVVLVKIRPLLRKVSPAQLIALGALAAVIRWPLTGLSPALPILLVIQALHALTFAATYMGTVEFIGRAVPEAYRTTAMTLVSTLGVGAMTGVATVIAGQIFDRAAPFAAYGLMGGMGAVALILSLALMRRWDGGLLQAVPQARPPSEG